MVSSLECLGEVESGKAHIAEMDKKQNLNFFDKRLGCRLLGQYKTG